jgi:hypothetical protein
MSPTETLQRHHQLCDELYQAALAENRFLRQHQRPADAALQEQKRALLARLDESLLALRTLPAGGSRDTATREQLERTRSRILQILELDKENEQLVLRFSLAGANPPPAASASPSAALLQRIYARCV